MSCYSVCKFYGQYHDTSQSTAPLLIITRKDNQQWKAKMPFPEEYKQPINSISGDLKGGERRCEENGK